MKCQMSNVKYQALIISFIIVFIVFSFVSAQFEIPSLSLENFSLEISPDFPSPKEEVRASLTSYSFDLDRSNITWVHNGKTVLKGMGEKIYRFKAGTVGKEEVVKAIILTPSGNSLQEARSIIVADADLLWQAKTSFPFAYQAKPLPVLRSRVKVVAEPHFIFQGSRISPSNLVYKWFLGEEVQQESSGFGRQAFEFTVPVIASDSQKVKVEISSLKGSVNARKAVFIPIREPKVLIYEEHPLQGPKFNRSLTGLKAVSPSQIDFRAAPYYFSRTDSLVYDWSVNGKPAEKTKPFNLLNLKIGEGFFGKISVNLRVENPANVLETAENNFEINAE